MKLREIAKKSSTLNLVNANLKSFILSRNLAKLDRHYNRMAASMNFQYSSIDALNQFKSKHLSLRPEFMPKLVGSLRVFWVGTMKDQDESGFLQSLNEIAEVSVFMNAEGGYGLLSDIISIPGKVISLNDEALINQIVECNKFEKIDLLLGQMWAHLVSKEALMKIQEMGIPVINIAMDDRLPIHWGYRRGVRMGSIGLREGVDMVLTTSPETCLWYGVEGCPAIYLPLASDPEVFIRGQELDRDIDVLFVGNKYGIREKIVKEIESHGINIACYGVDWPNGYVSAKENVSLSKRAKIILGVGTVGHSSQILTLKLRDFDAIMAGALYITQRNPDLCALFEEDMDFICYDTSAEAASKIRYYLEHEVARKTIADSGQAKAILDHSWKHRLSTIFRQLDLIQ